MNQAITLYQHRDHWQLNWIDKDNDLRSENFESFELASKYIEGELLA